MLALFTPFQTGNTAHNLFSNGQIIESSLTFRPSAAVHVQKTSVHSVVTIKFDSNARETMRPLVALSDYCHISHRIIENKINLTPPFMFLINYRFLIYIHFQYS